MAQLVWPVLAQQLLSVLVGLVDTWLTGNYLSGQAYLAAIGLASYTLWLIPTLFATLAIGAHALIARQVGAGQLRQARQTLAQALLMGGAWTVPILLLFAARSDFYVGWMQLEGRAAQAAVTYLAIVAWGIPAVMIQQVVVAALRAAGDTRSGLVVMAVMNLVNLVVSAGLVAGIGGFPRLGWSGLAMGTLAGYWVAAAVCVRLLLSGRAGLSLGRGWMVLDPVVIRRLLRVGIPGGVDNLALISCQLWFLAVINSLGALPAAAHTLSIRVESLAYLPGMAFQVAAATMAGQFLGAGQPARAMHSVRLALLLGTLMMTSVGVVFFVGALPLTRLFVSPENLEVAVRAVPLLRIVAFTMPALAIGMILSGAFRGAGDTRWTLLFTVIGLLGIRLPLAYCLALGSFRIPGTTWIIHGMELGVVGAWYAMACDLVVRALLAMARFAHGGWQRVRV
jgi:putative MATE family efflux protein